MTNWNIIKNLKTTKKMMNITTDKLAKGMNRLVVHREYIKMIFNSVLFSCIIFFPSSH